MKNFVFISPNFPTNYWLFCRELKKNGMNVLGIGDQPYDELSQDLKNCLNEYYKVSSLENEDEVYRAVAFFIFKYGRIHWLESNNEYWLEQDARLRTDFNIPSGFQTQDIPSVKYKSQMKKIYKKAGLNVARYYLVKSLAGCKKFVETVGYPVVAKPDNGVGASDTHKIENEPELIAFWKSRNKRITYIMEEFVHGEINSYDAIIDSHGEPMFETGNVTPTSIMDMVNNLENSKYYIVNELSKKVQKAGRTTVKAFGVKSRFVHFEFFRLLSDHEYLGKKGTIIPLEVNMRPCGGFTPDMINFAYNTDVYKIWADMIAFDQSTTAIGERGYCAFAGRRDSKKYRMDHTAILKKYGTKIKMSGRMPDALSDAMGNQMYIAAFATKREMTNFYNCIFREPPAKS